MKRQRFIQTDADGVHQPLIVGRHCAERQGRPATDMANGWLMTSNFLAEDSPKCAAEYSP
jgi:hypothetical protein